MFPGFLLALLYLFYVVGWVLINPKIAPKLPPDKMKVPIPEWLAQLSGAYSRRMVPAFLAAFVAPGQAAAAGQTLTRGRLLRSLGTSSVPLLLALVTMGTTWWYVVIYSQKDDRPAVTATATAEKQIASVGKNQDLPGPVPAGGGLQEPPNTEPATGAHVRTALRAFRRG